MKVTVDVSGCRDCVFKTKVEGQGYEQYACGHLDKPIGWKSIIHEDDYRHNAPNWCPLGLNIERECEG